MDAKHHAWLARSLIDACGGLTVAAARCRVAKSRLSHYQDPNTPDAYMAADVIACLEAYCGEPIYSRALFAETPGALPAGDSLAEEVCEITEVAAALQRISRLKPRGGLTARCAVRALADIDLVERHARAARQLVTGGEP